MKSFLASRTAMASLVGSTTKMASGRRFRRRKPERYF